MAARCLLDSHLHSSSHLSPIDLLGHLLGTFQGLITIMMVFLIRRVSFFFLCGKIISFFCILFSTQADVCNKV